jgi:polar amino acid transport system substrate-binding protein
MLRPLGVCYCLLLCLPALAAELPQVRFAANEWPPFVSATLPNNGLSGALVAAVFERIGYSARIDFYPWKRAMQVGLNQPHYAGLLAIWRTPEREKLCYFSSPIGSTLTVLAYLRAAPVRAATLAELQPLRIGTVAGYANGEQFDGMAASGALHVEEGVNDETNLRKLLIGRFPAIVIEKRVLRHLLASGRFSNAERERIIFSEQLFKARPVYTCFKRNAAGLKLQQAFNEAARDFDLGKIERDYWRRIGDDALPLPFH